MALVTLRELLIPARAAGRAICAINVANLETALAVIEAAEREKSGIIVQVYQRLLDNGLAGPIAALVRQMAERSPVPIALHLDHSETVARIALALDLGFTSVMLDGSKHPYDENVRMTLEGAALVKKYGASLEGEIGHVAFGGGAGELTDPGEAARFAKDTSVDALAISVGTTHGYYKSAPVLDIERVRAVAALTPTPLVLHGGSGTPREQVVAAVRAGIAKVNIATEFQHLFLRRLQEEGLKLGDQFKAVDLFMQPVRDSLVESAREKIRMLAGELAAK
jgi:ketose-bisphosphate aldolase